jgi:hypothetical protein
MKHIYIAKKIYNSRKSILAPWLTHFSICLSDWLQDVPLNVEPATTAFRSSDEWTTGHWVSHNAEHRRHMLVGGFRVTWGTLYM